MSIVKKLKKEADKIRKNLNSDKEFLELESFYNEMKKSGIAKTAKYDLPPVDTLGKRFYDIQHSADKKRLI